MNFNEMLNKHNDNKEIIIRGKISNRNTYSQVKNLLWAIEDSVYLEKIQGEEKYK